MKKIIVVSSHFPPLNTMAAKRFGYMCKYFYENGYDYTIISMRSHNGSYFGAPNDLNCLIDCNKVIYIGELGIVYPIYDLLTEICFQYVRNRGYVSRIMEESSLGWYEKIKKELDLNSIAGASCVIGTFPDICNILVAKYIGRKMDIPVIADIRDLISDYSEGMKKNKSDELLEKWMEKIILRDVSAISTTTSGFREILEGRYHRKKIITVYNGWELNTDENKKENLEGDMDYLYFAGTLYEHRIESLLMLVRLIRDKELPVYVKIRCIGIDAFSTKLRQKLHVEGLMEYAEVLAAEKESVVRREQRNALINLVPSTLDCNDHALMTTIPGKLFELIKVDRPVLAIIPDGSEIGEILYECNKGIATANYDRIAAFIGRDYKNYVGNKNVDRFSRQQQAKKLCELFDYVTSERRM